MSESFENMTGNNGEIGTYSVSVKSFFSSWKEKAERKPVSAETRKKKLRPIINPIFEKCAELTEDKFWENILMECACGKFPRNFTYKNNLITHRKSNVLNRLEISNSPSEAFTSIKAFFQKVAGIMSEQDRNKLKKIEEDKMIEELEKAKDEMEWKDVRKEKLKEILIKEFVTDMAEKYKMNKEQRDELITVIRKGFLLKYFTANNVEMERGRIVEIDGLIIDKKTKKSEIDAYYITPLSKKSYNGLGVEKKETVPDLNFLEQWDKYLSSLTNKRVKKSQTYSTSFSIINQDESEDFTS